MDTSPDRHNVELKVYDVDALRFLYPEWDTLDRRGKYLLASNTGIEALKRVETHNVTCVGLHTYLALNINSDNNADANGDVFAFGDDNSSFETSDTSLNNKVGEAPVANANTNEETQETMFSTFIDSSELNEETLSEVGLVGSDDRLWNHAPISPEIDKTSSETVVAEIYISFSD